MSSVIIPNAIQEPLTVPIAIQKPLTVPIAIQKPSTVTTAIQEPLTVPIAIQKPSYVTTTSIIIFLNIVLIVLQIALKISTFVLLIKYYDILNDNIKKDAAIKTEDYIYIYNLAIANIVFTVFTILCSLLACILYFIKKEIFKKNKKFIEISISILWFISSVLAIASYIIRLQIKNKYIKYLSDIYDKHLDILSNTGTIFFIILIILYL
jgi:hypothetical protein